MKIGATELRIQVGRMLQAIRKGHEVTITHRNQPVALITPLRKARKTARQSGPMRPGRRAGRKAPAATRARPRKPPRLHAR